MYHLIGYHEVLKTIVLLIKTQGNDDINVDNIKQQYLHFLNQIQPQIWHPKVNDGKYLYKPTLIKNLLSAFNTNSILDDHTVSINLASITSMKQALEQVNIAVELIKQSDLQLHDLFDLIINSLFYASSSKEGGGTVSSAIGVIWCSNRKNWTKYDVAEFLIHEMTHNLVFLDELRFKHYYDFDTIALPQNFALSALLKIPRPLDKVIHSLIVGYEILQVRHTQLFGGIGSIVHPNNQELLNGCLTTLDSVDSLLVKQDLVTSRVLSLLGQIQQGLHQLKHESIHEPN